MNFPATARVLVVCPHTDDEYGCLGTVIRLIDGGADVRYVAFSDCRESVPDGFPPNALRIECMKALKSVGIDSPEINTVPVRHFPEHRQRILERLYVLGKNFAPDVVFCPCSADTHQDHEVIRAEVYRAFKDATILGYALPWNLPESSHAAWVTLDEQTMGRKLSALGCYVSQECRAYGNAHAIKTMARFYGLAHGVEYAEEFEVIRARLTCG